MNLEEILAKLNGITEDVDIATVLNEEEIAILVENFEQLDEISKGKLGAYIKKASYDSIATKDRYGKSKGAHSVASAVRQMGKNEVVKDQLDRAKNVAGHYSGIVDNSFAVDDAFNDQDGKLRKVARKRISGIKNATNKLVGTAKVNAKEDVDFNLNELIDRINVLDEDTNIEEVFTIDELEAIYENYEQLDEISKKILGAYMLKSVRDYGDERADASKEIYTQGLNSWKNKNKGDDYKKSLRLRGNRADGIKNATNKLVGTAKVNATESVDVYESEAADTLRPQGAPGDSKTEMLSALVSKFATLGVEDLSWIYTQTQEKFGDVIPAENAKANAASIAMKEDVIKLFDGQELSEEFKTKTSALFEAAVALKVNESIVEIEDVLAEEFVNNVEALEESFNEAYDELLEKTEAYIEHVAEEFIKENELAIESTLKTEISEDFMNDLRNLFLEHNINIPTEEVDVVEELMAEVSALREQFDFVLLDNKSLREEREALIKDALIEEYADGLPVVTADKFRNLAESVEMEDAESFESKLKHIKESWFSDKKVSSTSTVLTEEFEEPEAEKVLTPAMKAYASTLSSLQSVK